MTAPGQTRVAAPGSSIASTTPARSMSLGLAGGPLPRASAELTAATARWLMDRGVHAVALHLEDHDVLMAGGVERVRRLLADHGVHVAQATGNRPMVSFDPVNLLGSLAAVYSSGPAIATIGERLGPVLAPSAHVKDIRPAPALVLHLDEVPPGDGFVDWAVFFAGCRRLEPGSALIVEHLDGGDLEAALARVAAMASAHGIELA